MMHMYVQYIYININSCYKINLIIMAYIISLFDSLYDFCDANDKEKLIMRRKNGENRCRFGQ